MLFVRVFAAAMRQLWRAHRGLTALTIGSGLLLAVSLLAGLVDARQVLGAPVWMKPAKFAASVAVAAPLMAWIIGQMVGGPTLGRGPRFRRLRQAGNVMALMGTLELVIITVQAVRGVPSHFNASSPVNGALFTIMGIGITVFWLAQSYVAARSFRHPFATGARTWAIRLGLAVSLLGGGLGFLMPRPTPAQLESLRAGRATPVVGAHAVGVPDGGPGLPVSRWSTEGGDLRVPHFFGLHALQGLPLLALLLERGGRPSARPIVAAGIAWGGLTLTTLVQALRGQPLLSPDAITLAMLLAFGLVSLAVARGYLTLNASDGGRSSWLRGSPVQ
jgi:hypothetical protein